MVTDAAVPPWNKLRIVMLYALRYQQSQTANIATLINLMLANGVSREDAKVCPFSRSNGLLILRTRKLVYVLLNVAGSDHRQDDLFSTESLLAKGRSALKGLKVILLFISKLSNSNFPQGLENVYMQHTPHLSQTLEFLFKGKLKETSYPFLDGTPANAILQRYVSCGCHALTY
jgi:hypothetical protein